MKKYIVIILIVLSFYSIQNVSAKTITRADAALYIAEKLDIKHTKDPKTLYGLAYDIMPGDYIGNNDVTSYNKKITLEVLIVTLVKYAGWNTVEYDTSKIDKVSKYVSKEGYPYYSPDPTPRSIPYVISALENKLLKEDEIKDLTKTIDYKTIDKYIKRFKNISELYNYEDTIIIPTNENISKLKNMNGNLIIANKGLQDSEYLKNGENITLDLRSSGVRLYKGDTKISNARQMYFPLGPLETVFSVGIDVQKDNYSHQSEAIFGTINNFSTTTNAVAIWGNAQSSAKNARVWGGFINVLNAEKKDAQLIGLEIDVENTAEDGISPNESKIGLQIVSLGNKLSTSAIEVLAAGNGTGFSHGLIFGNDSISKNGTIIGATQNEASIGLDFSNTDFTNAAILLKNNSKIVFRSKSEVATPSIYTDEIDNGYLVVQSDESGIRFVNKDNNINLLTIRNDGTIDENCEFYKKYIATSNLTKYEVKYNYKIIYILSGVILFIITIGYILHKSNKNLIQSYEERIDLLEELVYKNKTK